MILLLILYMAFCPVAFAPSVDRKALRSIRTTVNGPAALGDSVTVAVVVVCPGRRLCGPGNLALHPARHMAGILLR